MRNLRKQAKEMLQAANKVYHYRHDVISEGRLQELDHAVKEVNDYLEKGASADKVAFEAAVKRLDSLLRKIGGKIYPKTFWSDNIEVILVAIIVVVGVRTFFFQPFIIPTNSMYPTYSGMNSVVYKDGDKAPGHVKQFIRLITLGARHKELIAQNSGEISIPVIPTANGSFTPLRQNVKGKKWFVFPTVLAEYTLLVDNLPYTIRVPADFNMNEVLTSYMPGRPEITRTAGTGTGYVVHLGRSVEKGEPIVEFDITLGDALFVDRLSYHFVRPEAGDPFVFRTGQIPGIEDGDPTNFTDKYYIKRIGGAGGEQIEIRDGGILLYEEPRTEVKAFIQNAAKEGDYEGYLNVAPRLIARQAGFTGLDAGDVLEIPEDKFVALGDNSDNSLDSRVWGFVPEKAVIGRAIFIYYPFTERWGIAE